MMDDLLTTERCILFGKSSQMWCKLAEILFNHSLILARWRNNSCRGDGPTTLRVIDTPK